jgi:hypothetical protein
MESAVATPLLQLSSKKCARNLTERKKLIIVRIFADHGRARRIWSPARLVDAIMIACVRDTIRILERLTIRGRHFEWLARACELDVIVVMVGS